MTMETPMTDPPFWGLETGNPPQTAHGRCIVGIVRLKNPVVAGKMPFLPPMTGNGFYQLFMMIWEMVLYWFLPTLV